MNRIIIIAGLLIVVTAAGCGSGSVEHEYIESPQFSGQRTRIKVRSREELSGYRVIEGQPVNVHVHAGNGKSICIEITTDWANHSVLQVSG